MKSCVNDIYWQKCSQSPRAVADCCRFSSLNDKGATNFDPYSCHFFINNYEQSQRYFQWSSYSHFASHWAGAVVALNILQSSELVALLSHHKRVGNFYQLLSVLTRCVFFSPSDCIKNQARPLGGRPTPVAEATHRHRPRGGRWRRTRLQEEVQCIQDNVAQDCWHFCLFLIL